MSFGERLNARAVLERRRDTGALTWAGLATMLFARSICAIVAQGLVAAVLAVRGSAAPWRDAAAWFPVYATLIDAGCLALFYMLMRREGARLVELLSFDRRRFGRDVLVGLLLSRQAGSSSWAGSRRRASWSTERRIRPRSLRPCCWGGALYATLVFPLVWDFAEQMTYNGYLTPRFEVLARSSAAPVARVAFSCSFQHVVMPVTFDASYVLYRMIAPIPFSIFIILVYLRTRLFVPLAVVHGVMNGADAFTPPHIAAAESLGGTRTPKPRISVESCAAGPPPSIRRSGRARSTEPPACQAPRSGSSRARRPGNRQAPRRWEA